MTMVPSSNIGRGHRLRDRSGITLNTSAVIDGLGKSGSNDKDSNQKYEQLLPREDEPNLNNFPASLSPEYKKLPFSLKTTIASFSALSTFKVARTSRFLALSALLESLKAGSRRNATIQIAQYLLKVLITTFITFFLTYLIVQDTFYPPDRIDTSTLLKREWMPSTLSKFSFVNTTVPSVLTDDGLDLDIGPMGVHYLEYPGYDDTDVDTGISDSYNFDVIHFNHGFGASSLSWLPAIPSIVTKLGARCGLAHDAPGFGFTDRPKSSGRENGLVPFSSAGSAALGNALILNSLEMKNVDDGSDDDEEKVSTPSHPPCIGLFGHSMGCAATLKMALSLPVEMKKEVILVSPALVGKKPAPSSTDYKLYLDAEIVQQTKSRVAGIVESQPSTIRTNICIFIALLRSVILDPCISYLLKRAVGRPKFWSNGLRLAWGTSDKVNDSDALRFQWPSIGRGWEGGLLSFTRSRLASTCTYDGGELKLLQDVLKQPNTRVTIIHGSSDPIVPFSMSRKIVEELLPEEKINLISMPGMGHDPFEEGMEEFIEIVTSEIFRN